MNKLGRCGYIPNLTPIKIKIKKIEFHENHGTAVKVDYLNRVSRVTYFLFDKNKCKESGYLDLLMRSKYTANAFIRKVMAKEDTTRFEIDGLWTRTTLYEEVDVEEGDLYGEKGRRSVSLPFAIMKELTHETLTRFESIESEGLAYHSGPMLLIQSALNRSKFKSIKISDYSDIEQAFKAAFILGKQFKQRSEQCA